MLELCSEPTFYNPGNMCFFMVLHSEKPVKQGLGLKKKCSGRKKRELSWVSGLPKHTLKCWEIVNVTFFWCRSNIITKYNIKYYIYYMDSSNIYLGQDIKMMGKLLRQDWLRGCTVARRNPAMTKGGQSRKFRIANDSACLWLPVERARRGTATPPLSRTPPQVCALAPEQMKEVIIYQPADQIHSALMTYGTKDLLLFL